MKSVQKRVLIVGASRGIGFELSRIYREEGCLVVELNRDRCELSDPESVRSAASDPALMAKGFDLCIFSAGLAEAGYIDDLPADAYRRCMEVNFHAPLTLFLALARAKRPCRNFVFILAGVGEFLIPGTSPYALSKRALREFLRIASMEKAFDGCRLMPVWPGYVLTQFKSRIQVHGRFRPPPGIMPKSPETVARKIFAAERYGKRRLVLSTIPNTLGWIQRIWPQLMELLISLHPRLRQRR